MDMQNSHMIRKSICIAAATSKGSLGGPETWVLRISRWLMDAGVDVTVLIVHEGFNVQDSSIVCFLNQVGVPYRIHFKKNIRVDTQWYLQQVISLKPSVFIANHVISALFASYNLAGSSMLRVMLVHSDDPIYYKLLDTFVLGGERPSVDQVVVVSEYLEKKLSAVLSPFVEVTRIPYGAPDTERQVSFDQDILQLIYVGRFTRMQKRIDDVAKALCLACKSIPGVRATMVGDGSDRSLAEGIVNAKNCGDLVKIAGPFAPEKVMDSMAESHVMVLLSDFEGIPVALQEGMSLGLVPIVSPIESGIPELVIDGQTGYIVSDRSGAFVEAVRKLKGDAALWQKLSTNARMHFRDYFSQDSVTARWLRLIPSTEVHVSVADEVVFPITGWKDFWVDESIVSGVAKYKLLLTKSIWRIWDCIPEPRRVKARRVFRALLRYDGFRLRISKNSN
jgi:glycosyltransferase involved in cell wall biosynthesis